MSNEANTSGAQSPSHLARADRHAEDARQAFGRLSATRQGLRLLFGEAVVVAVDRAVEDVTEHQSEAIYHLRAHLAEVEDRHGRFAETATSALRRETRRLANAAEFLRMAVAEENRRAKRAKRAPAEWATEAAALLADLEEPF